jgi:excisionase family DNA binding protein
VLTVKAIAERLGICESVVRRWITSNVLPHFRLGANGHGAIRVEEADLQASLAARKQGGRRLAPSPSPKRTPIKLKHLRLA